MHFSLITPQSLLMALLIFNTQIPTAQLTDINDGESLLDTQRSLDHSSASSISLDDEFQAQSSDPSSTPLSSESASSTSPSTSPDNDSVNNSPLRSTFWLSKKYHIACCLGGTPTLNQPELAQNFTYQLLSYVIDEQDNENVAQNCRLFKGSYLLPPPSLFNVELNYAVQVVCKCPDIGSGGHALDRNCRRLPICLNNGFRSLIDPRKCLCIQPFFGERCEKFCDQGQRLRGMDGRDYCHCTPYYRGEECREIVCLNGGREEGGRCVCQSQFLGYHCEIDTNKTSRHHEYGIAVGGPGTTGSNSRFQRFGDQNNEMFTRDISGTIFSLIMIVVLVVSMYLLMKHRMQVQSRYLSRRPDLLGACNFPTMSVPATNARRIPASVDHSAAGTHSFPFQCIGTIVGDGGPPPYIPPNQRGRRARNDVLPPLPTYEDATKLPPFRQNTMETATEGTPTGNETENVPSVDQPPRMAGDPDRPEMSSDMAESDNATLSVMNQRSEEVHGGTDPAPENCQTNGSTDTLTAQSESGQQSKEESSEAKDHDVECQGTRDGRGGASQ